MAKKISKKTVTVHEHPMHVPVSKKNPTGVTIRDQHLRRLKGTYLDREEIGSTFKNYDRKSLIYPASEKLEFKNSDKYDEIIAVWTDYFNKKFNADPNINIPMAIRWLFRKMRLAEGKLGRGAAAEEIILEYKGLLKSKTSFKNSALEKFRKHYAELKQK